VDQPAGDKLLRDSLGHLPFVDHAVEVLEGDRMSEGHFVALFQFKRCQRKLRFAETMSAEFVARGWWFRLLGLFLVLMSFITAGRIWWLRIFYWRGIGKWCLSFGLSQPSLPARPEAVILIEAQRDTRDCASQPPDLRSKYQLAGAKYTLLAHVGWV
jgi:hypothetical protein